MRKNFFLIICFVLLNFIIQNSGNAYSSDPKQFITEIVDEAKKILVASNDKEFKEKKLTEIALATVDISGIGYYTLGSYRKDLTDEQLKKYVYLFRFQIQRKNGEKIKHEKNPIRICIFRVIFW